ncbi:MAG TPA: cytochrome c [Terriglobales bacterium]|nr:cytochrome c [Terriglobales bacterium]
MTKKLFATVLAIGCIGAGIAFWLSQPEKIEAAALPAHIGDKANGEILFHAGGCISCHKPGDTAKFDPALPSGGAPLATPIGTLYPPNITPDVATGIGSWSDVAFVNALKHGVSPSGENYVPAFPYTSYAHMTTDDILDIKAYLMSLKPVNSPRHDSGVPVAWVVRHGVGLWKRLALSSPAQAAQDPKNLDPSQSASWNRGAYLVNGPGHCAECHTPRDLLLVPEQAKYLEGGLHPNGRTKVPSLHNLIGRGLFKDAGDLADGLKEGEEGGYENMSAGGMGEVQSNLAKLPDSDVKAIADYLASLK